VYIPRVFYVETRFHAREPIESVGLEAFIGISETVNYLEEHVLKFHGIVLQDPVERELFLVTTGEYIVFTPGYTEYCKWHNGPLDKRDDPLKRTYCLKQAYTRLGYCREHDESLKALYDKCFASTGIHYITSCRKLDEKIKDLTYVLYLLDYGHGLKVGTTRAWRLYTRIGEQPHIVATKFYETTKASEIRSLERKIGSREGFTERPHKRSLKDVIAYPPKLSYRRLSDVVKKLSRELGIELKENILFRVIPSEDIAFYAKSREVSLSSIVGRKLEIIDYWAGYLLLSEPGTNTYYILKTKEILHRDSIGAIK